MIVGSEMIERVAKALANETDADWEAMPLIHKLVFRGHAKAALQALMEPTPAMVEAGLFALSGAANTGSIDHLWQAMIRSAMEGE